MSLAIGYIRVSTDEQALSGLSLEAQRTRIQAQAVVSDHTLGEIYQDPGASGADMRRPGLQAVLEVIRAGGTDALIVAKMDRLTRNVVDLARMVELFSEVPRMGGGHGLTLISAGEYINTDTAIGRLSLYMMGLFGQYEREKTVELIHDAHGVLRRQGRRVGTIPWGFQLNDEGLLVDNPAEQRIIRIVRELRRAAETWEYVAEQLNSRGLRTRKDGLWTRQGISQIAKRYDERERRMQGELL